MILDKLLEKKDVLAYINFRKKQLKQNIDSIYKTTSPEHRAETAERLNSRVGELSILADLIHSNKVKKRSIEISESLNEYGQKKDESDCTIEITTNADDWEEECHCDKLTDKDKSDIKEICKTFGIPYSELKFD